MKSPRSLAALIEGLVLDRLRLEARPAFLPNLRPRGGNPRGPLDVDIVEEVGLRPPITILAAVDRFRDNSFGGILYTHRSVSAISLVDSRGHPASSTPLAAQTRDFRARSFSDFFNNIRRFLPSAWRPRTNGEVEPYWTGAVSPFNSVIYETAQNPLSDHQAPTTRGFRSPLMGVRAAKDSLDRVAPPLVAARRAPVATRAKTAGSSRHGQGDQASRRAPGGAVAQGDGRPGCTSEKRRRPPQRVAALLLFPTSA